MRLAPIVRWIMLLLLLLPATVAVAAPPSPATAPLQVSAQRLVSAQTPRRLVFTGEVVAQQGDVTLYCQQLTIYYGSGSAGAIERVEALRDVRLVQGDRVATGDRGLYLPAAGRVVLTGHARVHRGRDLVEGDTITVYLKENRSEVDGKDDGRVKATVFPRSDKGAQP